ncbi:hypothetical protein ACVWVY_008046 [Bradyrhizobium sp. URHC0002]
MDSSNLTDLDRVYDRIKQAARKFGAVLANAGGGSVLALAFIQSDDTFGRNVQCVLSLSGGRCLIPRFDRASLSSESKDALWARFFIEAPRRQRRSVERYELSPFFHPAMSRVSVDFEVRPNFGPPKAKFFDSNHEGPASCAIAVLQHDRRLVADRSVGRSSLFSSRHPTRSARARLRNTVPGAASLADWET